MIRVIILAALPALALAQTTISLVSTTATGCATLGSKTLDQLPFGSCTYSSLLSSTYGQGTMVYIKPSTPSSSSSSVTVLAYADSACAGTSIATISIPAQGTYASPVPYAPSPNPGDLLVGAFSDQSKVIITTCGASDTSTGTTVTATMSPTPTAGVSTGTQTTLALVSTTATGCAALGSKTLNEFPYGSCTSSSLLSSVYGAGTVIYLKPSAPSSSSSSVTVLGYADASCTAAYQIATITIPSQGTYASPVPYAPSPTNPGDLLIGAFSDASQVVVTTCGASDTSTGTTVTATITSTPTPSSTLTVSATRTGTRTPSRSPTASLTLGVSPSSSPSVAATPSTSMTPWPSSTQTPTPSFSGTSSVTVGATPSPTVSLTPSSSTITVTSVQVTIKFAGIPASTSTYILDLFLGIVRTWLGFVTATPSSYSAYTDSTGAHAGWQFTFTTPSSSRQLAATQSSLDALVSSKLADGSLILAVQQAGVSSSLGFDSPDSLLNAATAVAATVVAPAVSPTPSATLTPSPTRTVVGFISTSSSSSSSNNNIAIGAGVGLGVGIPVLLAVIYYIRVQYVGPAGGKAGLPVPSPAPIGGVTIRE